MNNYFSREAVEQMLVTFAGKYAAKGNLQDGAVAADVLTLLARIRELPDEEPSEYEFVLEGEYGPARFVCKACGKHDGARRHDFCPHCGRRMKPYTGKH